MKTFTINNKFHGNNTSIENEFIDHYMVKANGEYIKVYLFLLRHLNNPCSDLTISKIADCLENTEKDILRAMKYWEKAGILTLERDETGKPCGVLMNSLSADPPDNENDKIGITGNIPVASDTNITMNVETIAKVTKRVPEHRNTSVNVAADSVLSADIPISASAGTAPIPAASAVSVSSKAPQISPRKKIPVYKPAKSRQELKQLLFVTEQYLGKTLTKTEVDTITYFYDTLDFSADLIEYLIEYCVDNNHKSIHYIQKVALSWADEHITTVDEAREHSSSYNKNYFTILKAFGITGRAPASVELDYMKRWFEEYGFTLDMILEACDRTIASIHHPSFEYADSILKNWLAKGVHHLSDIEQSDLAYLKAKEEKKKSSAQSTPKNKFQNFEGRTYDMEDLERQLLNS